MQHALAAMLSARLSPAGREWVERWLGKAAPARFDRNGFFLAFATATRKLSGEAIEVMSEERVRLERDHLGWLSSGATVDELGRISLLHHVSGVASEAEFPDLVAEGYRTGDNREKRAVLRALPLLP